MHPLFQHKAARPLALVFNVVLKLTVRLTDLAIAILL